MKIKQISLLIIIILGVGLFVLGQSSQKELSNDSEENARRIWEKGIEAKGGREKLYAVKNILEEENDKKFVCLYIFPNKLWRRSNGPSPFGLSVEMFNGDTRLFYSIENGSGLTTFNDRAVDAINAEAELFYLLETQRTKPVPYKTEKGKLDRKKVDIVFTKVKYQIYIYYFDEKTHLPLGVGLADENEKILLITPFADYAKNDGIQMPQKRFGKKTNYRINVEYDEDLFRKPPTIEATSDAWKKKQS